MERRTEKRTRRRIACEIIDADTRHSGIVLDISPRGLFVQTNAHPAPGTVVDLQLKLPGGAEPVALRAKVARQVLVPPQLTAVAHGGVGLRLIDPPPEYAAVAGQAARIIRGLFGGRRKAAVHRSAGGAREEAPTLQRTRYRIDVVREDGSETDSYTISATSEEAARKRLLRDLGDGWKVVGLEPA